MKKENPIFIAGPACCGASMLAGLLHHHGIWITDKQNAKHLISENADIRQVLHQTGKEASVEEVRDLVLACVPDDRRWLFKSGQTLNKFILLNKAFPEAIWVLPKRPLPSIIASAMSHPMMQKHGEQRRSQLARWHVSIQYNIAKSVKYSRFIDMDSLVNGSKSEVDAFFDFCLLDPNYAVVSTWLKPNLWNKGELNA